MEPIETARLLLESWQARFRDDFVRLAADPQVMRHIGAGASWDQREASGRFAEKLEHWRQHGFGARAAVEKTTGVWLGFVEIAQVGPEAVDLTPDEVEIGWWLAPSAWGRGLATEGALAVRDEAFGRFGLDHIVAR